MENISNNVYKKTVKFSEEIRPNSPTIAKVCSLWNKCVVAPLFSIVAAISNKVRTGNWLTTNRVFNGISIKILQGYILLVNENFE